MHCDLLIPALNEEAVIAEVLDSIPHGIIRRTVVVDNGSTDSTAGIAASGGAIVVHEPVRGYGSSMARGIRHLYKDPPDIVAFMDADGSDDAGDLSRILSSVTSGDLDLCIGSRLIGDAEAGSMHLLQHAGTRVACVLLRNLYGLDATDLGPLRAINWQSLMRLDMQDRAFGWTAEMQAKAARAGMKVAEVPVSYRRRRGRSKISGTVNGTYRAGRDIISTLIKYRHWKPRT